MTADQDGNDGAEPPVTFTDIARLAIYYGYAPHGVTRQGVRKRADTDPAWPVPPDQWVKIGNAWAMPWEPIRQYLEKYPFTGRLLQPKKPRTEEQ